MSLVQGSESITNKVADFVMSPSFIGWQKIIRFRSYAFDKKKIRKHIYSIQQDALKGCIPCSEMDANGRLEYRNRPSLLIATFNFHELMDVTASRPLKRIAIVLEDENWAGESVLVRACRYNAYDTLKIIQTRFPKDFMMLVQAPQPGRTLLYHAVNSGSAEVIRLLVEHGADPVAYSKHREFQFQMTTALQLAVYLNSVATLNDLLQQTREDLNEEKLLEFLLLKVESMRSPWELAIMEGNTLILEMLLAHASAANILRQLLLNGFLSNGTALNYLAVGIPPPNSRVQKPENLISKFELLLKFAFLLPKEALGEFLTTLCAKGYTALHLAASTLSAEHVKKLLRSAWWVSENTLAKLLQGRSRDGRTALHMAAELPFLVFEQQLMVLIEFAEDGAPSGFLAKYLRLETADGKTARDIAAAGWEPDNKVAILDDVLSRFSGPREAWNPRLDIVSSSEIESSICSR